ncbi:hypothetical protein SUGI_0559880 [Cryptomeria japonica]|nr:hypothetical protein SUGI_0559880 [Cryptomeria japonica]
MMLWPTWQDMAIPCSCASSPSLLSQKTVIRTGVATEYWIGEGLVTGPNPVEIGEIYVNLLADRCLIEPFQKNHNGKVIYFRMHDLLHDLAHQIAEKEEKCFFRARRGLGEFPADDCGGR